MNWTRWNSNPNNRRRRAVFDLTQSQKDLQARARDLSDGYVQSRAAEVDEIGRAHV